MPFLRISDFAFAGLSHVFTPPGMPLVEKSVGVPPTTSVLVRGAAGTGKSTLALAVAHEIARASEGMVLYLVTEASLSDVAYKAELLALPAPVAFKPETTYDPGTIGVTHLILEHEDAAGESTSVVQMRAIDTIEELLEKRPSTAAAPVRAIVIDGFGLPEANNGQGPTRSDLIGFIQGLEDQGISPVLIEETGDAHSPLLTFAVDVVFTIAFDRNADTGELLRQLTVSKSRYSDSSPGPHDAVLDNGKPALWPRTTTLDFGPPRSPVGFFMPVGSEHGFTLVVTISEGAVILSQYDHDDQSTIHALTQSPGLVRLDLDCGPTNTISLGEKPRLIPSSHGPAALLWALSRAIAESAANAIVINRLEYLLSRPRFATFIPEMLDRLARRNILICVHGTSAGLAGIAQIARFTGPKGHYYAGDRIAVPKRPRPFRAISLWDRPFPELEGPSPELERPISVDIKGLNDARAALEEARKALHAGDFQQAAGLIESKRVPVGNAAGLRVTLEQMLLLDRIGKSTTASNNLHGLNAVDDNALAALGWSYAEMGNLGEACRTAFAGINRYTAPPSLVLLWNTLWLRLTGASIPTAQLFHGHDSPPPIQARALAHAAASRKELQIADQMLADAARRAGMLGSLERLKADARLESPETNDWKDAAKRYEISLQETLSPLDHADILFNLGHIHERFDERDAAIAKYQEALRVNPLLEPALDRLQALGVPFSLPTTPTSSN